MQTQDCRAIFKILKQQNKTPTTELVYNSVFELLIAVMLSAQATDVSVNLATKPLFATANTPQKIFALGVNKLKHYIKTIGLYNTKAHNIIKTCKILIEEHSAQVPAQRQALEALPGVGRKTANVVLNTAFGEPVIAVDTHILRVANRTGMAPGKTPRQVEDGLMHIIPKIYLRDAHHWLILHGRYTCIARKPACDRCKISRYCAYYQQRDHSTRQ